MIYRGFHREMLQGLPEEKLGVQTIAQLVCVFFVGSAGRSSPQCAALCRRLFGGLRLFSLVCAWGRCGGELSNHRRTCILCGLCLGASAAAASKLLPVWPAAARHAILQMPRPFYCL